MSVLDKNLQQTLMKRLEALPPEKFAALDKEIGPNAAMVMLYDLMPELDFLLLEHLDALQGHQYQPEQVLGGAAIQERMAGQQTPQGAPAPAPQAPQGALGGLVGNP